MWSFAVASDTAEAADVLRDGDEANKRILFGHKALAPNVLLLLTNNQEELKTSLQLFLYFFLVKNMFIRPKGLQRLAVVILGDLLVSKKRYQFMF